jgi:tape measure domain-containing protein
MADERINIVLTARDLASREVAGLTRDVQRLGSEAGRTRPLLQGMAIGAGVAAFQALQGAVSRAADFLGDAAFGFNARLEQAQIGFETMLGSGERARSFLNELKAFAVRTPFRLQGLLENSQMLLGMGFAAEEVVPTLTSLGNAVAGLGRGQEGLQRALLAIGQIRTAGRLMGTEARQLAELGIPVWTILAEKMGLSTAQVVKLSQDGLIPANDAIRMLTEGMEERFGGLMAKNARTFSGAMSNIADISQQVAANAFLPLFNSIRDGAVALADFLQTRQAQEWASRIAGAMKLVVGGFEVAATVVGKTIGALGEVVGLLNLVGRAATATGGSFGQLSRIQDEAREQGGRMFFQWIDGAGRWMARNDELNRAIGIFAENYGNHVEQVQAAAEAEGVSIETMFRRIAAASEGGTATFEDALAGARDSLADDTARMTRNLDDFQRYLTGKPLEEAATTAFGSLPDEMQTASDSAVEIARRAPAAIAAGLLDNQFHLEDASAALVTIMTEKLNPAVEAANIIGFLVGDALKNGMASTDPEVRRASNELRLAAEGRLRELADMGYAHTWGANTGNAFADGLASASVRAERAARTLAGFVAGPLRGYSPPREGPLRFIDKWGENVGKAWAQGLSQAASSFSLGAPGLPAMSGAGGTHLGGTGGARVEIPIYLDGREVARAISPHLYYEAQARVT